VLLDWNTAIESRPILGVDIVYVDFAKAFNSVVHINFIDTKLIAKLQCNSVCGMILHWIESWLCNRNQWFMLVVVHRHYVGLLMESSRVVCLDLYCLLIRFVNDIFCCMADNVSVKLFAVNAKIYTVIDSLNFNTSQLQHSLDLVAFWVLHLQLKLSPTKCSVGLMRLNSKRTASVAPTYTVGGAP